MRGYSRTVVYMSARLMIKLNEILLIISIIQIINTNIWLSQSNQGLQALIFSVQVEQFFIPVLGVLNRESKQKVEIDASTLKEKILLLI